MTLLWATGPGVLRVAECALYSVLKVRQFGRGAELLRGVGPLCSEARRSGRSFRKALALRVAQTIAYIKRVVNDRAEKQKSSRERKMGKGTCSEGAEGVVGAFGEEGAEGRRRSVRGARATGYVEIDCLALRPRPHPRTRLQGCDLGWPRPAGAERRRGSNGTGRAVEGGTGRGGGRDHGWTRMNGQGHWGVEVGPVGWRIG